VYWSNIRALALLVEEIVFTAKNSSLEKFQHYFADLDSSPQHKKVSLFDNFIQILRMKNHEWLDLQLVDKIFTMLDELWMVPDLTVDDEDKI